MSVIFQNRVIKKYKIDEYDQIISIYKKNYFRPRQIKIKIL